MTDRRPPGYSLVGLLITLVCVVVLFTIGMSAMNRAITGEGSAVEGTVHSMQDQFLLYGLHQAMYVGAQETEGEWLLTPSLLTGNEDVTEDTTANLFSAMVMQNYVKPEQLISANEFSGYVDPMVGYDYRLYSPRKGVHWDPAFRADLDDLSNVSFAHLPLYGRRLRAWRATLDSGTPLLGNRGPKDGMPDPMSYTYGRNGRWGGHVLYGDGRIDFLETFTPPSSFFERDGVRQPDNLFAMEDGPEGVDAILSFTREMTPEGPVLQHD